MPWFPRRRAAAAPAGNTLRPGGPAPDPREEFWNTFLAFGKARQTLVTFALLSMCANVIILIGYVRVTLASRFVPFVYVVDRAGEVLALGGAKPLPADTDTVVYLALGSFVTSLRAVYSDPLAEKTALTTAYAYLPNNSHPDSTSLSFVTAYLSNNDPRTAVESYTRSAEIVAITKLPGRAPRTSSQGRPAPPTTTTWRIRWRETIYPIAVGVPTTTDWEAFAAVTVRPKQNVEAFDTNPFGIFVESINWSRITPEKRSF
jgi:type IV secretory pathway TrbF-like protein